MSLLPTKDIETIKHTNFTRVVGIDEVGRGCWAGPVAVGAFSYFPGDDIVEGVNDSKKVSKIKREKIAKELAIYDSQVYYGNVNDIDTLGISQTIESLVIKAIEKYDNGKTFFVIDGVFKNIKASNILISPKADSKFYSVAAASILAKVARDALMIKKSLKFPQYGFENHKGYGTKMHLESLLKFGVSNFHRKTFKPLVGMI